MLDVVLGVYSCSDGFEYFIFLVSVSHKFSMEQFILFPQHIPIFSLQTVISIRGWGSSQGTFYEDFYSNASNNNEDVESRPQVSWKEENSI